MWNGQFAKHRDYQHSNFYDHAVANGGYYQVGLPVKVDTDPVTLDPFVPPRLYFIVNFTVHTGETYPYLVPAEADKSQPNEKRVRETVIAYAKNPVPGGRKIEDFIHDELTPSVLDAILESHASGSSGERRQSSKFSIDDLL